MYSLEAEPIPIHASDEPKPCGTKDWYFMLFLVLSQSMRKMNQTKLVVDGSGLGGEGVGRQGSE